MKRLSFLAAAMGILVSAACAPAAPTADPAQIQASAVAAASTMVALTQQAMPSATPLPSPTPVPPTPLPSPTMLTLPTLPPAMAPTTAPPPTASGDACNRPMSSSPEGPMMTVSISNNTDGTVTLSLYLYKTQFGECGYWGTRMKPRGSASAYLPQGGYFAGAFVDDPKAATKSFGVSINMWGNDKYHLVVGAETIQLR